MLTGSSHLFRPLSSCYLPGWLRACISFWLLVTGCWLLVSRFLVAGSWFLSCVVCRVSFVVCRLPFVVCCLLFYYYRAEFAYFETNSTACAFILHYKEWLKAGTVNGIHRAFGCTYSTSCTLLYID